VQRAKWAHIITISATAVAAVAAIGGLWAQALATYWDSRTAKDQLSQSQDDSEKEKRSQASHVAYWTEITDDSKVLQHVLNRSPDPVTGTVLYIRASGAPVITALFVPTLQPCSETILKWTWPDNNETNPNHSINGTTFLLFVDRNGISWKRDYAGLVVNDGQSTAGLRVKINSLPNRLIEAKKAPSCDDGVG
jgi:hypothetical protein